MNLYDSHFIISRNEILSLTRSFCETALQRYNEADISAFGYINFVFLLIMKIYPKNDLIQMISDA